MFEREGALEQVVEHASGRTDDDVCAGFERGGLCAVAHAAVDGHRAQTGLAADLFGFLPDLAGQFAGGDEDQRLAGRPGRVETRQHGQEENAGLAAAGAGLDHHIAPGQQIGNGARLHGYERSPAGTRGGFLQIGRQLFKGDVGQRVARAVSGWNEVDYSSGISIRMELSDKSSISLTLHGLYTEFSITLTTRLPNT